MFQLAVPQAEGTWVRVAPSTPSRWVATRTSTGGETFASVPLVTGTIREFTLDLSVVVNRAKRSRLR